MVPAQPPGAGSRRVADFAVIAAAVFAALVGLEWFRQLFPALSEFCQIFGVALAASLLATLALRRRDARAQRLAGQTAEQARSILESAVDAILTIDERGTVESLNRATAEMFGHPPEALIGRNVSRLMPPPYREQHGEFLRRYLETGERRIIGIGREVIAQHASGRIFPIHLTVSEARVGSRRLFTGIVRDLSEPRQAEQQARALGEILEQSLNEIYVFDDQSLRFELVNRGARENLGYSLEELRALTPLDIKPEYTREAFEALLAPLRIGAQRSAVFQTSHRRKDGSLYRVEVHMQHALGNPGGRFVAIVQDISERESLEAQLAQARKLEAIGQLAGGIAHDFNNLLTSIQGSSELLAARLPESDRSQRALGRIRQAAERGAALTQKLLAFGRRQASQPEVLDPNLAVTQISELAGRLIGEDIEVALELDPAPHPVLADRTQIDQVLLNLVVNASDAMPSGGKLRIATRNLELDPAAASRLETQPGAALLLEVEDTGTGMTPEVLSHIFEPFFTTKGIGKGTGLGLATVYGIVKQNGWGIEVSSEPGRGSSFSIYLPRSAQGAAGERAAPVRRSSARGRETLLLVEDDALLRDMATEILEAQGYDVAVAADPQAALRRAEELGPQLALLISDVVMPQMTGPQLAARLRETRPDLRVLLISGYAEEALEARGAHGPGMELLAKPFSNDALVARIRSLLDG